MPLDPTIPLQAATGLEPPPNPLDMISKLQGMQNQQNQNALFQGQRALGQAYQNALDQNGQLDPIKLRQNIAADPRAAPAAQSGMESAQSLSGAQLGQAFQKLGFINNATSSLLQKGNITSGDVDGVFKQGVASGLLTPDEATQQRATMPTDPAGLAQWVQQHHFQAMDMQTRLAQTYGMPSVMLNGQTAFSGVVSPAARGGGFSTGSAMPVWPSREALLSQSAGTDANGNPTSQPLVGRAAEQGVGGLTGPAGGQGAAAASPRTLPPGVLPPGPLPPSGSVPRAVQPMASIAPTSPPQPGQQPSAFGAIPTGLSAQTIASQQSSLAHYAQAAGQAGGYQDRILPLQQAAKALDTAKTGEGSEALQSIASRIQTLTPDALLGVMPNIRTPDEIAAYDEARKYLTMAQQSRPGADRSDAGLATAGASSPSVHISPQAAKLLVQAQLGVERGKQAMFMEFNATHPQGTEGQYDRWITQQQTQIDPRAFITDQQTPAQRQSYYQRLGPQEQQNYLNSYALGKKHQLLTLPNGQ